MSPLSTWALTVGFITVVLVLALVVNGWLDHIEERARRRRHTDPEPIFRRDAARDVMRSWSTYRLHYTSADGPGDDSPWSVYREEYPTVESPEPIEGRTVKVSTWPSEQAADDEARRLQSGERP